MDAHAHLHEMSLPELADRLEDLDHRRTPVGWSPDDAVERASILRTIREMVSSDKGGADGLPCELQIMLRNKEQELAATVREVRPGGVVIKVDGEWIPRTHVEMRVASPVADEPGLRARGIVTAVAKGEVVVSVTEQPSEAHERRLARFLLELVRHRVHN